MSSIGGRQSHILYFLLLAILGSVQIAYAQSDALTLEEIVSLKRVTGIHMSPKGDQIAYLLSVPREIYKEDDGKSYQQLYIVDLNGISRPYVSGKVDVSDVAWSADGQTIYFIAMRDPDEKFNSLFEIALTGGEAIEKFTHLSSIDRIYPSPDGTRLAWFGN